MPNCPECRADVGAGEQFCVECGAELPARDEPVAGHPERDDPGVDRGRPRRRESGPREPESPVRRGEDSSLTSGFRRGEQVALGGAAIAALGTFLPWMRISVLTIDVTFTGVSRDGVFSLVAAAVVVAVVLFGNWGRASRGAVVVFGLIAGGVATIYLVDPTIGIENVTPTQRRLIESGVEYKSGIYLTAIGGFLAAAGGVVGLVRSGPRPP